MSPDRTVRQTLESIQRIHGATIQGEGLCAFAELVEIIGGVAGHGDKEHVDPDAKKRESFEDDERPAKMPKQEGIQTQTT
jgi:hypothetical protein